MIGVMPSAVAAARVEVWQADDAGSYDNTPGGEHCRGTTVADGGGVYRCAAARPGLMGRFV
jgi:protocatechuate 3,4-dioxygenase beta subunit